MKWILPTLCLSLLPSHYLCAQQHGSPLQAEMSKVDALAADPDLKLVVVAAMAESLQVHRNHLLLLRRETGQTFAAIFVSELRARSMDDDVVTHRLRELRRNVQRQHGRENAVQEKPHTRPVLLVGSSGDHSAAGTIYSLIPEFGFDSSHVAVVVGVPYYRISNSSLSSSGVGDVYASALLRGRTAGWDIGCTLTVGAPTGDRDRGLGAGKVTVDGSGSVARRIAFAKPWVSGGFANSVFNNVGYQRPYITDGNVAHFSGGVDFALRHKVTFGFGGFGLVPMGNQIVYSQTVTSAPSSNGGGQTAQRGGGMMPGGGMGSGMGGSGLGGGGTVPVPPVPSMPFYDRAQQSTVSASELRDYGASTWLSIPLHSGLTFNAVVAHSFPFNLTSIRVGLGIDVGRLLFPHAHF